MAGLLTAACVVPWYFEYLELDDSDENLACNSATFYGWKNAYCTIGGGEACASNLTKAFANELLCPYGKEFEWRTSKLCTGKDHPCDARGQVYDVSIVLTAIAGVCSIFSILGFFLRWCCESKRAAESQLLFVTQFIGFACLAAAVAYFAISMPKAYQKDNACDDFASLLFKGDAQSPCDSFFGSFKGPVKIIIATTFTKNHTWGPSAWIVAAAAIPVYMIVVILSCAKKEYRNIQDGRDVPVAVYTRY